MSGKIMGLAVRSLATALCLCAGLSPGLGRTGAAVRRRRRPRALRRGSRRPVAPGVADQDHDGLPDVRGHQAGQAHARVQDHLLRDRQSAGPHQGRPASWSKPDGRERAACPHHPVGQRRRRHAGRGDRGIARGLRRADERHGRPPRHDAHAVCQRQRLAGARADHHRAGPRQAVLRRRARLSRSTRTCGRWSRPASASVTCAPTTGCSPTTPAPTASRPDSSATAATTWSPAPRATAAS